MTEIKIIDKHLLQSITHISPHDVSCEIQTLSDSVTIVTLGITEAVDILAQEFGSRSQVHAPGKSIRNLDPERTVGFVRGG